MSQPQETDPCASIRQDVTNTQKRLKDFEFDLSHPEDLTTEQEVEIKKEVAKLKTKLGELKDKLRRCVEANPHSKSSQMVPSEAGWEG